MIVSASRRTDIPCHYGAWMLNRLRAGYALSRNPFSGQVRRVSLAPEDVDCIVFWTKDAQNFMDKLPILDAMGYSVCFQFTLNPYGASMEPGLRDKAAIAETFAALSGRLGKHRVLWRYDPILIDARHTVAYHMEQFARLCETLHQHTERVTISFVDPYPKLRGAFQPVSAEDVATLAAFIGKTARAYELDAMACCERIDLSAYSISRAACIDAKLIERIVGKPLHLKKSRAQRPGCGCCESIDIGAYDTCANGCAYCYANRSAALAARNFARHDPLSEGLFPAAHNPD